MNDENKDPQIQETTKEETTQKEDTGIGITIKNPPPSEETGD